MFIEQNTKRKAIKNPFAKIHQAALENGGSLSEDVRKKMMKDAIEEMQQYKQSVTNTDDVLVLSLQRGTSYD